MVMGLNVVFSIQKFSFLNPVLLQYKFNCVGMNETGHLVILLGCFSSPQ